MKKVILTTTRLIMFILSTCGIACGVVTSIILIIKRLVSGIPFDEKEMIVLFFTLCIISIWYNYIKLFDKYKELKDGKNN